MWERDYIKHFARKKREDRERQKGALEHIELRNKRIQEQEKARAQFVEERNKRPLRSPAAVDGEMEHSRQVASQEETREEERSKYLDQRRQRLERLKTYRTRRTHW